MSIEELKKDVERGCVIAMNQLGYRYAEELGQLDEGIKLFRFSKFNLACKLYQRGSLKDKKEATELFKELAKKNHPKANFCMGRIYRQLIPLRK